MKKLLFFAAALLCLVACNNKDNALNGEQPIQPGQQITLSANVNFNQGSNSSIRTVTPNTPISGANATFRWEADDQVMITDGTNYSLFTIINDSISEDGKSAKFTGTALASMSSYYVFYAGKGISKELVEKLLASDPIELTNATDNYNIIAVCEDGNESGFTMNEFANTLRLQLTGKDITLGSVKYYCAGADIDKPSTTINFGTDGLALTTTAQEVWLPINATNSGLTFRFYDTNGELIMEKSKDMDSWTGYQDFNELVTFPELEIKKAHFICFESTDGNEFTVGLQSGRTLYPNLQYTTTPADPDSWKTFDVAAGTQNISADTKLYVRAGNTPNASLMDKLYGFIPNFYISLFVSTGSIKVSGNIMALLNQEPATELTSANDYAFYTTFMGTSIVDASELILPTNVVESCFGWLFCGCTALKKAPVLPATTMATTCYKYMFQGCSALESVPALPAKEIAPGCYSDMFSGCSALESVPTDLLPAKTLYNQCYYNMFIHCSSLKNAPDLPATTLAGSCYMAMFDYCTNLEAAPVLAAEALKPSCYGCMFAACPKINSVTMLGSVENEDSSLLDWLAGAAETGTVYVKDAATKATLETLTYTTTAGTSPAIPEGWTVVVK